MSLATADALRCGWAQGLKRRTERLDRPMASGWRSDAAGKWLSIWANSGTSDPILMGFDRSQESAATFIAMRVCQNGRWPGDRIPVTNGRQMITRTPDMRT